MVPSGWEVKLLGSLTNKIGSGKTPKGGSSTYQSYGIPLIRSQNVLWGSLDLSDVAYIDEEQHQSMKNSSVSEFDVLLNITGASIGRVAISTLKEANVNQHVCIIRPKKILDNNFLKYNLLSFEGQKQIERFQAGGNRQGLNFEQIKSFKIMLPPLPEQQKIAKILTTWDKAINTTQRLIENSKQQKKALMQQLLTGQKRLLDDSGQRFSGDWEEVQLKTVLDLMKSGLSRKLENNNIGIAVIRSNNMGPKYTTDSELKYWYLEDPQGANVSNYILDDGDLLVNFINSLSQIGKACIYKKINNTEAIYTTNILRIKPNLSRIDPVYLYLVTQTSKYDSYITSITKPAVNQASFTTKDFGNYLFDLPSLKEQQKIAAVLTNADREIEVLEQQLADLQQEKKALMQQLLIGKKRVLVDL
ncbi:restriction endonuclease subunit S [Psychrobacter sanguinis]|uniref:restriction endonuclease subunit S n=1 Tax=Psychrobacter sanguinis TaxID=861445 RepID=UPI0028B15A49|nr:restriction endonuclease subunit S [Psychrobacter sanguinis]